jgi:hypothetical protein
MGAPGDRGRAYCPMGELEPGRGCTSPVGDVPSTDQCPRLEQCEAERRGLSAKFNAPMSDAEIKRLWPGAHRAPDGEWVVHRRTK